MRTCPICGSESPPEARFCAQCGTTLAGTCERCGAELPPTGRYCPSCGAPVSEPASPGEERKLVTVLFADVAGSTALGERLDPERLKEVMGAYFEAMRREIEAEGGTVEKFIGDAVMAVFGVPAAHEDDPVRALRAALRMRRELAALNETLQAVHGVTLAMRIGVNTGEVVAVPQPRPGEGMVVGDAVNVASRLEHSAETGQVLVAERTARASRGLHLREVGRLALKGKEDPVRAFELLEPEEIPQPGNLLRGRTMDASPTGPDEDTAPRLAPLVGRDRELALLASVWERVTERRPHLVTIYGEAGIGKSRLVDEFTALIAGVEPLQACEGRCLPYGEGVAYWPLAEILTKHAGVLHSDPPDVALRRISEAVGGLLHEAGTGAAEAESTVGALAFTLGLQDPARPFEGHSPQQVRVEAHEAWRAYFSALARRSPTVVVIEDLHWADTVLLDLLEELAERAEGPLLFLCPSRPELTARRPSWGGGRWNFSGILLEPLTEGDARLLVDFLLGDEEVSDRVRERILDRAGGNPFFLEEIAHHLIDERTAIRAEEGWLAAETVEEIDIPDTVQGVLAARMDLLGAAEKRVLQMAAVVGKEFWSGPVARLVGPRLGRVEDALARLEDRGLVTARLGSTMGGEREFAFRHGLTRDVAYESLPRKERAVAHAEVAAWIEERSGDRQREVAELLVHHYSEAYRGMGEDRRSDPERLEDLRSRAFRVALVASEDARSRLALAKAESHAETALAMASGPRERSMALEALGKAYVYDSMGDAAWEALREAVDLRLATDSGEPAYPREIARLCADVLDVATRSRGAMRVRLAEEDAAPYLELGLSRAGEGDSEELARLLTMRSFWPYSFRTIETKEDELLEAREAGEHALAMAERLGRPDLATAALDGVGSYYSFRGLYGSWRPVAQRRLELVESLRSPWEVGDAFATASWIEYHIGRYRDAERLADEGFQLTSSQATVMALYCLDWRAVARCRLGDWDAFFQDQAVASGLLGDRREQPPGFAADHVAAAAFLHEVRGDQGEANRLIQVVAWLDRAEQRPSVAWSVWRSLVLARRRQFDEAWALLDRQVIVEQGYGRGHVLEARCDVLGEQQAWDQAPALVVEARAHAEETGLLALPGYADRLEGRAKLAGGDADGAAVALSRAVTRFDELEAGWETAVTRLDLAEAMAQAGRTDDARTTVERAVPVLDRLRSLRELVRASELLERLH